ncbi:uncharacterized protein [Phyllobates terribilis]|uniref:uncharacterized protein n=1 Tax=Phyllobates terribilis TaxID=111132 RepID=UPI003CCAB05A
MAIPTTMCHKHHDKDNDGDENSTPFERSGLLNKLTFWWLNPLIIKGRKKPLEDDDIPRLRKQDQAETFMKLHLQKNISVLPVLFSWQWKPIIVAGILAFFKVLATSTGPIFIKLFIEVAKGEERFSHMGYALTAGLLVAKCVQSFCERQCCFIMRLVGIQVRSMFCASIYNKQLKLSPSSKFSSGEIVSLVSIDAYRLGEFSSYLHQIWITPFQLFLSLLIVYSCVGLASLAAVFIIVLTVLVNSPLAKLQAKYQRKFMEKQDKMVKFISTSLSTMKVLKLYAWDMHFKKVVEDARKEEYKWLKSVQIQKGYNSMVFWSAPVLVPMATFGACYFLKIDLTIENVFMFLASVRLVQEPIKLMSDVVGAFIDAKVALSRIMRFLDAPELKNARMQSERDHHGLEMNAVSIKVQGISWDDCCEKPNLKNIDMVCSVGDKVAICGEVGAGKSTLLATIIGEVPYVDGQVKVNGKIAYVSQTPWIQSQTIQENILFGSLMDSDRYHDTLDKCCLTKDLEMLPFGDLTLIGERGVNLSGGQKQRVQLARALYQNADIYLLDDPFSAVDAHTATSLFNGYVMEALAGKTVFLVTHQVDFLHAFNSILLMSEGEVLRVGTYNELLASSEEFNFIIHAHNKTASKSIEDDEISTTKYSESQNVDMKEQNNIGEQLIKKEEKESGSGSLKPYIQFMKHGNGFLYVALSAFSFILYMVGQFLQSYWLAANLENSDTSQPKLIAVYAIIGCSLLIFLFIRGIFIVLLALGGSKSIFSSLITSLFRAPMSFYDSTPLGRILSRVSYDLNVIDLDLSQRLIGTIGGLIYTYSNFGIFIHLAWEVIFLIIPMIFLIIFLQRYYYSSAKELMRINGTTKSALASYVAETAAGVMTIRAFGEEQKFSARNLNLIDRNATPFFHNFAANEWFIQRLEIMYAVVLSAATLLVVVSPQSNSSAGYIGLALSYGISLDLTLMYTIQSQNILSNMMVSVERLGQYMNIPSEAPQVIEQNRPSHTWPHEGKVEICNLKVRYQRNSPLVLMGISCVFEGGNKIGIVGRTGSGKTTLINALFRLVEPTEGKIIIDGLDISTIGLHDLRSHFGVIPQEAILFDGSVRYNLDPLSEHSDHDIWEVLEKCQLKEAIQQKPEGLSSLVVQDGSNWSMGQRQLFCLGRALLKRRKILVLDEATASIDNSTDMIIQRTIRREFASSTVITVAHRIPTVMDCTRVLSLSDGNLVEYDDPAKLIAQETSWFGQLVREYYDHTAMTN